MSPEPIGLAVGGGLVTVAALRSTLTRLAIRRRLRAGLADASPGTRVAAVQTAGENGVGRNARMLLGMAGVEDDIWVRQVLAQTVIRHRWEPASTTALVELRIWAKQELLWGRLEPAAGPESQPAATDLPAPSRTVGSGIPASAEAAAAVLTESGWWDA